MSELETDYLVVGAGATPMAFIDTLLTESDAEVVVVDRHHRPGGHWNDAYPFVRLHQPSAQYGVNSRPLGSGRRDVVGLNAGLSELASGAEVVDYYEQVMNQVFLPSGRLRYFPMCDYHRAADGSHLFTSLLSGQTQCVRPRRRLVDGTLARTAVPSTHPPKYEVAAGVRCIPVNDLPRVAHDHEKYVVVGSGKTGIDACLWLLQSGAPPERIRWIMPQDAWFMNRANVQPGSENFETYFGSVAAQLEAIAAAASLDDLMARLEAADQLLRLDPNVKPTVYRCATVTKAELAELRRIADVVRLGRIQRIAADEIILERGRVPASADMLYIDCSAAAIVPPPRIPVFEADRINLLMVRTCQPVFSGALIAYVESHIAGDEQRNAMCKVVPSPQRPADWLRMWAAFLGNRHRWGQHEGLANWLQNSRLDGATRTAAAVEVQDAGHNALMLRYKDALKQAVARMPELLAAMA